MSDEVKVAVIGLGMGGSHARNLLNGTIKGGKLVAVCDFDEKRLANFPEVERFQDAAKMFEWNGMDAVIVATPHFAHTTLGIETFKHNKHLLVEKPISVHKADCERLFAAHTNPNLVFCAMFNKRTNALYAKVKELLVAGELGEIRRINWINTDWFRTEAYYRSGGWRATWSGEGGGVLLNQCPHELDLWQWLFGMPSKLRAFCQMGRYHDIEVEDDVTAYMEYGDGTTGVFVASTGEAPGTNRLEIVGERGKLVAETSRGWGDSGELRFMRNEIEMTEFSRGISDRMPKLNSWDVRIPIGQASNAHSAILQNFVDAIRLDEPLIAPGREGGFSVELANAMIYSSLKDETVHFPLNAADYEKLLNDLIEKSPRTIRK